MDLPASVPFSKRRPRRIRVRISLGLSRVSGWGICKVYDRLDLELFEDRPDQRADPAETKQNNLVRFVTQKFNLWC